MRKIFWSAFILSVLSTALFYSQALSSSEDTAQLTFSKTAISKKPIQSQIYTVQKGDVLSVIIRKISGITEKNIPNYYRMTKELNPNIENLNKLYAGQKIVLPGKSMMGAAEKTATTAPVDTQSYQVKKGDNLIGIVHRELHITSKTQKTMLLIKSLNPTMTNAHKLYVGQIIRLPEGLTLREAGELPMQKVKIIETEPPVVSIAEEQQMQPEKTTKGKDSIVLSPEARLDVIKHIITQMNGNMITNGNYYLPVTRTEQLTIDCSIIPVVELDDRTTMFLDLENRSNRNLKKMISERWSNYHLVKIDAKDDIITILKKILKNTKTYELTKAQKPISVSSLPPMEVFVDWVISRKNAKQSSLITQGLRFIYENTPALPRAIVNCARQHSLIITEISPEKGLAGKPEEIYSLPPMTVIPSTSAKDFSYALLSYLNIQGEKDVDIRIFNIDQDGFNMSIKADVVVTRGEKKTLIFSRNLSPQFVNILQKEGNKLIFISDQDVPAKTMEKILQAFSFVYTSGYFSFSGLDKNRQPYSLGFNGTKIKTDKDIYVVNFDFNQDLRGLMQEAWSANIVRY